MLTPIIIQRYSHLSTYNIKLGLKVTAKPKFEPDSKFIFWYNFFSALLPPHGHLKWVIILIIDIKSINIRYIDKISFT